MACDQSKMVVAYCCLLVLFACPLSINGAPSTASQTAPYVARRTTYSAPQPLAATPLASAASYDASTTMSMSPQSEVAMVVHKPDLYKVCTMTV